MEKLTITSPCFKDKGLIPVIHTGYGADISPEIHLHGLVKEAVSIAIIMNDIDHPLPSYNHWIIWNIPAMTVFPGNIQYGAIVETLNQAVQGIGYGKNRYRGPKPPFNWSHNYQFNLYVLDCVLDLPSTSRRKKLLAAMKGHILQQASLTGHYR